MCITEKNAPNVLNQFIMKPFDEEKLKKQTNQLKKSEHNVLVNSIISTSPAVQVVRKG